MKVGIMQPYFFPYLGYFGLIRHTNRWIVFDSAQFIRHGWIERNRILKPSEGWQYISVPLEKHGRDAKITEVRIRTGEDWRERIFRQLEHYKKKARYYQATFEVIEKAFKSTSENIVDLNVSILETVCSYLGIHFNYEIFSRMGLNIKSAQHPGEWALNICKGIDAKEYVNPIGGIEIFRPVEFADAGIELTFLKNRLPVYDQRRDVFEPGLSILDVMMFNDRGKILEMLDDFETVKAV